MELFSVNTIFFTILDYPMSYLEFFGTLLYLLSVWLIAKRNMLTWPVGIVSVFIYMALFYQYQLYSDTIEQLYYVAASCYGWWYWRRSLDASEQSVTPVFIAKANNIVAWVAVTLMISVLLGWMMSQVNLWLPELFPEPASFPYLDALTSVMSFVAMWLMARRHAESWVYWIIVDVIGIWLYYTKGIKFVSLLYVILLGMACMGGYRWFSMAVNVSDKNREEDITENQLAG